MGTVARLRKLIKEESTKLGHDIGYFHKIDSETIAARCVKCGLIAAIHPNEKVKKVPKGILKVPVEYKDPAKTFPQIYPPKSKGIISTIKIITTPCEKIKDDIGIFYLNKIYSLEMSEYLVAEAECNIRDLYNIKGSAKLFCEKLLSRGVMEPYAIEFLREYRNYMDWIRSF